MDQGWETKEEIRAAFEAKGLAFSERKLERWREERLLPDVDQLPLAYKGSEVRYPVGTAAQAIAVQELLTEKRKFDYVGWELWWRGFSIDERHWRPRLIQAARWGDKALRIFKLLSRRDDERDSADTIADRTVQAGSSNSFYLKIKRRVSQQDLPALLGMLLDVAAGDFEGAIPEVLELPLKRAFDMEDFRELSDAKKPPPDLIEREFPPDLIQRWGARLTDELPSVLRDIARVSRRYSLAEVTDFPQVELEAARDDVRRTLQMTCDSYDAISWLYGRKSFGLRLAAWVAQTSPPSAKAFFTLVFAARRRDGHPVLSSEDICRLANDASLLRERSIKLRELQNDPRFSEVLSPKRLRHGLQGQDEQWTLLKEIEAARIRK